MLSVFICVDMEGATGVVHHDQLMPDGKGYSAAQKLLTGDVNAAIKGIRKFSPEARVVVGDGHGVMRNVLLQELDVQSELVIGPARFENKQLCQCEGLDNTFDIGFCVGYHSMAGTPGGLLAHTFVGSAIARMLLNGKEVGEVEVNAAIMGYFGIPLGLVVGNSDLEPEIREFNSQVQYVSTKQTLGPTAAICKTPHSTSTLIEEAAFSAVKSIPTLPIYSVNGTYSLVTEFYRREAYSLALSVPGVIDAGDRKIFVEGVSMAEVFRTTWQAVTRAQDEAPFWLK